MLKLERTELALEQVKAHLLSTDTHNPQIENYLAQYLTVTFYSEMERKVKDVYGQRIARNADERVRYFAESSADSWSRLVPKSDIAKLAQCFGDECKNRFNEALEDREVTIYSNVIGNRHDASHGLGGTITVQQIEDALAAASNILNKLKEAID